MNRCRQKGHGPSHLGCQNLLATLLSQASVRVLLPSVTHSNRRNLHLIEKQRKALYCDQRMERCELLLQGACSPERSSAGLLYRVLVSRDRRCSLKIVVQLCCLRLQIGVPSRHCVSSNPHKAHCRHLEEWHPVQTSAHSTKLRTPCSH